MFAVWCGVRLRCIPALEAGECKWTRVTASTIRYAISLHSKTFSTLLSERWPNRQLKPGEDVTPLVGVLGLKLPAALKGAPIVWIGRNENPEPADASSEHTLVLTRPGKADALGLTIGCVRIHGRRYCLECGFWYCRIVIKF